MRIKLFESFDQDDKMLELQKIIDELSKIDNSSIENIKEKTRLLDELRAIAQNISSTLTKNISKKKPDLTSIVKKRFKGSEIQSGQHNIRGERFYGWVDRDTPYEIYIDFKADPTDSAEETINKFNLYLNDLAKYGSEKIGFYPTERNKNEEIKYKISKNLVHIPRI